MEKLTPHHIETDATRNIESCTKRPMVSIVMPAYGVARYIARALDSVLGQTFKDYEIIVVNDGAPDTEELEQALKPYEKQLVYIKQENRGVSAARNTGIRAAGGHYIALFDPDDILEPEYLAVQINLMEQDPALDVLYANAQLFGNPINEGKTFMDLCPSRGEVTFESLLIERCTIILSGVVARKQSLIAAGLFDEDIRYTEDYELWLRLAKLGGRIKYHHKVLLHHRQRPDSTSSSDPIWLYEQILRTFEKISRWDLATEERAIFECQYAKNRAMLSLFKGKKAILSGSIEEAIHHFTNAKNLGQNRKIEVVLLMLRFSPNLLRRAYHMRERISAAGGSKCA